MTFIDDIYQPCLEKYRDIQNIQDVLRRLDNGTAILKNDRECDEYIAFYAKHHFYKLRAAFQITKFQLADNKNLEIIDWGCGQALATCVLVDYLIENGFNPNLVSILLIEPSSIALKRGFAFTNMMLQNRFGGKCTVITVNKQIDALVTTDLVSAPENSKIHIFSNIIDVKGFSLDDLHTLILNSFQGHNRIICTSPANEQAHRLDDFTKLFSKSCKLHHQSSSDETLYKDVFFFKSRREEERPITRHEIQFSIDIT